MRIEWKLFVRTGLLFLLCAGVGYAQVSETRKPDANFKRWDKNSDGVLEKSELPRALQRNFEKVDTDDSGSISIAEHLAFLNRNPSQKRNQKNRLPEGSVVKRDIAYVEAGHQRHKLDLCLPSEPDSKTSRPLVIWIHGGGWRQGSKDNHRRARELVENGFAVALINYRLTSHAQFPAQIHDCKAAIRFLRKHAAKYGIDPDRFGVWGSSAGGHLAALVGTSGDSNELDGDLGVIGVSSQVQAVCDWYGPTDLLKMNEQAGKGGALDHDSPDSPESKLLGGPLQTMKREAVTASPITYVTQSDPPFLIMHGDQDRLVPIQQSQQLNTALVSKGVRVSLVVVKGAGHGFPNQAQTNQAVEFFKAELQKQ